MGLSGSNTRAKLKQLRDRLNKLQKGHEDVKQRVSGVEVKQVEIEDAADGSGDDAQIIRIDTSTQVFVEEDGSYEPSSITLRAASQNIVAPDYKWTYDGNTVGAGSGYPNTISILPEDLGDDRYVDVTLEDDNETNRSDTLRISLVRSGTDSVTTILGNQNHTFPADSFGNVSATAFDNGKTDIEAYEGADRCHVINTRLGKDSLAEKSATVNSGWVYKINSPKSSGKQIPIGDVNFSVGEQFTFTGEMKRASSSQRGQLKIEFYDSSDTKLTEYTSDWVDSSSYEKLIIKESIPANTSYLVLGYDSENVNSGNEDAVYGKNASLYKTNGQSLPAYNAYVTKSGVDGSVDRNDDQTIVFTPSSPMSSKEASVEVTYKVLRRDESVATRTRTVQYSKAVEGDRGEGYNILLPKGDTIKNSENSLEIQANLTQGDSGSTLTTSDPYRFADENGDILNGNTQGISNDPGGSNDLHYSVGPEAIGGQLDVFLYNYDSANDTLQDLVASKTLIDLTEPIVPIVDYTGQQFYHQNEDGTWETGTTTINVEFVQGTINETAQIEVTWDGPTTGWSVNIESTGSNVTVPTINTSSDYSRELKVSYENPTSGVVQNVRPSVTALEAGSPGEFTKHIFIRKETRPDRPPVNDTGGTYYDPTAPTTNSNDWKSSPPSGNKKLWISEAIYRLSAEGPALTIDTDGDGTNEEAWSLPTKLDAKAGIFTIWAPQAPSPTDPAGNVSKPSGRPGTTVTWTQSGDWYDSPSGVSGDPYFMAQSRWDDENNEWSSWKKTRVKGDKGDDAVQFYIQALDGTALKNSSGSLKIAGRKISGASDSILSESSPKVIKEGPSSSDTTVDETLSDVTEVQSGDIYYDLGASYIDSSKSLYLQDENGNVLDTITLVDITDALVGSTQLISGQRTYYKPAGGSWETGETKIKAQFVQGDAGVVASAETHVSWDGSNWSIEKDPDSSNGSVSVSSTDNGNTYEVTFSYTNASGVTQNTSIVLSAIESGEQGEFSEFYYIRPTNGQVIRNSNPGKDLPLEGIFVNGPNETPISGNIKFTVIESSSHVAVSSASSISVSDDYNPTFDEGDISEGSLTVYLRDTAASETLDSVSLSDVTDGVGTVFTEAPQGTRVLHITSATDNTSDDTVSPNPLPINGVFAKAQGGTLRSNLSIDTRFKNNNLEAKWSPDSTDEIDVTVTDTSGSTVSSGTWKASPEQWNFEFSHVDPNTGDTIKAQETVFFEKDRSFYEIERPDGTTYSTDPDTGDTTPTDLTFRANRTNQSNGTSEITLDGSPYQFELYEGNTQSKVYDGGGTSVEVNHTDVDGQAELRLTKNGITVRSVSLIDIKEGSDAIIGSVEVTQGSLTYRQDKNSGTWSSTTNPILTATFYRSGSKVAEGNIEFSLDTSTGEFTEVSRNKTNGPNDLSSINIPETLPSGAVTVEFSYGDLTINERINAVQGGDKGDPSEYYYINALDGRTLKNSTGDLSFQSVQVVGNTRTDLTPGDDIKLHTYFEDDGQYYPITDSVNSIGASDAYNPTILADQFVGDQLTLHLADSTDSEFNPEVYDSVNIIDNVGALSGTTEIISGSTTFRKGPNDSWTEDTVEIAGRFFLGDDRRAEARTKITWDGESFKVYTIEKEGDDLDLSWDNFVVTGEEKNANDIAVEITETKKGAGASAALTFTYTEPNIESTIELREQLFAVSDGNDSVQYQVDSLDGKVIKNTQGSITLQAKELVGDVEREITTNYESSYKIRTLESGSYLPVTDSNSIGASSDYNPTISPGQINGNLVLYLGAGQSESDIVDSISLSDVTDGLSAGYVRQTASTMTHLAGPGMNAVNPSDVTFTSVYADVEGVINYEQDVDLSGSENPNTGNFEVSWSEGSKQSSAVGFRILANGTEYANSDTNTNVPGSVDVDNNAISEITVEFTTTDPYTGEETTFSEQLQLQKDYGVYRLDPINGTELKEGDADVLEFDVTRTDGEEANRPINIDGKDLAVVQFESQGGNVKATWPPSITQNSAPSASDYHSDGNWRGGEVWFDDDNGDKKYWYDPSSSGFVDTPVNYGGSITLTSDDVDSTSILQLQTEGPDANSILDLDGTGEVLDSHRIIDLTDGVGAGYVETPDGTQITYFTDGTPNNNSDDEIKPQSIQFIGRYVPSSGNSRHTDVNIQTQRADDGVGINAKWTRGDKELKGNENAVTVTDQDDNNIVEGDWYGPDYASAEPTRWTVEFAAEDEASDEPPPAFQDTVYFNKDFAAYIFDAPDGKKFKTNSNGNRIGPDTLSFKARRVSSEEDKILRLDKDVTSYYVNLYEPSGGGTGNVVKTIDNQSSAGSFEVNYNDVAGTANLRLYKSGGTDVLVESISIVDEKDGTDGNNAPLINTKITKGTTEWFWDRDTEEWEPPADGNGNRRTKIQTDFYKGASKKGELVVTLELDESNEVINKHQEVVNKAVSGSFDTSYDGLGTKNAQLTATFTDNAPSNSWSNTVQYSEGDVVEYNGSHYIATGQTTVGVTPDSSGANWNSHTKEYQVTESVKLTREGRDQKVVTLNTPSQVFIQKKDGTFLPDPDDDDKGEITLTAQASNISPTDWKWFVGGSEQSGETSNEFQLTTDDFGGDTVEVKAKETNTQKSDSEIIKISQEGTDGTTVSIVNDTFTYVVNPDGTIQQDLSKGTAEARLLEGANRLTINEIVATEIVGDLNTVNTTIKAEGPNGNQDYVKIVPTEQSAEFNEATVLVEIRGTSNQDGSDVYKTARVKYNSQFTNIVEDNTKAEAARSLGDQFQGLTMSQAALGYIASLPDDADSTDDEAQAGRWRSYISKIGSQYLNNANDDTAFEYLAKWDKSGDGNKDNKKGIFSVGDVEAAKRFHRGQNVDSSKKFLSYHDGDVAIHGDLVGDELVTRTFTVDLTQALAGSDFLTKSTATLASSFVVPSASSADGVADGGTTQIVVEDNPGAKGVKPIPNGDWVRFRVVSDSTGKFGIVSAWGKVKNPTKNGNGTHTYEFQRGDANPSSTNQQVGSNAPILSYGKEGQGIIKRTVEGKNVPYTKIQTWTGNPVENDSYETKVLTGNLDAVPDLSEEVQPTGYGFYGDNAYLEDAFLEGTIFANEGKIADWEIVDSGITTDTLDGQVAHGGYLPWSPIIENEGDTAEITRMRTVAGFGARDTEKDVRTHVGVSRKGAEILAYKDPDNFVSIGNGFGRSLMGITVRAEGDTIIDTTTNQTNPGEPGVIGGWIATETSFSSGNLYLDSVGEIRSDDGATTYWKLNEDGSGHLAQENVLWDTNGNLTVNGTINASGGDIGGWTINSDNIKKGDVKLGSNGTIQNTTGAWALKNNGDAVFGDTTTSNYIEWDDSAGNLTIQGTITANSGSFGGWSINPNGNNHIESNNVRLTAGGTIKNTNGAWALKNNGDAVFGDTTTSNYVEWDNSESKLTVKGTVNANAGNIGGWTINSSTISSDPSGSNGRMVINSGGDIRSEYTDNGGNTTVFWKLQNDGSGHLARENISWTANGSVSISGSLYLSGTISTTNLNAGLYAGENYMGYWNGSSWETYIGSGGDAWFSGGISANDGLIGSWNIEQNKISSGGDTIELDNANESISVSASGTNANSIEDIYFGQIYRNQSWTGDYGIYAEDGNGNRIFELSDNKQKIGGWTINSSKIKATDSDGSGVILRKNKNNSNVGLDSITGSTADYSGLFLKGSNSLDNQDASYVTLFHQDSENFGLAGVYNGTTKFYLGAGSDNGDFFIDGDLIREDTITANQLDVNTVMADNILAENATIQGVLSMTDTGGIQGGPAGARFAFGNYSLTKSEKPMTNHAIGVRRYSDEESDNGYSTDTTTRSLSISGSSKSWVAEVCANYYLDVTNLSNENLAGSADARVEVTSIDSNGNEIDSSAAGAYTFSGSEFGELCTTVACTDGSTVADKIEIEVSASAYVQDSDVTAEAEIGDPYQSDVTAEVYSSKDTVGPKGAVWRDSGNVNVVINGRGDPAPKTASSAGDMWIKGTIDAASVNDRSSDRRLKENIQPVENPLQIIREMEGKTFDYKGKRSGGLIAQDAIGVYDAAVDTYTIGEKEYFSLDQKAFMGPVIEGIKMLDKSVNDNSSEIEALKEENKRLRSRIKTLEKKVL